MRNRKFVSILLKLGRLETRLAHASKSKEKNREGFFFRIEREPRPPKKNPEEAQEEARQREQAAELELALRQMNRAARIERGQEVRGNAAVHDG